MREVRTAQSPCKLPQQRGKKGDEELERDALHANKVQGTHPESSKADSIKYPVLALDGQRDRWTT